MTFLKHLVSLAALLLCIALIMLFINHSTVMLDWPSSLSSIGSIFSGVGTVLLVYISWSALNNWKTEIAGRSVIKLKTLCRQLSEAIKKANALRSSVYSAQENREMDILLFSKRRAEILLDTVYELDQRLSNAIIDADIATDRQDLHEVRDHLKVDDAIKLLQKIAWENTMKLGLQLPSQVECNLDKAYNHIAKHR